MKSSNTDGVCSRHLVISLYVLINDETSWKQHLMLESCRFELSVTGLLCWSGLGLESDFSNSCNDLDSFQGYFYSDLCCSWLPLEAFMSYLCTVLLKKQLPRTLFPIPLSLQKHWFWKYAVGAWSHDALGLYNRACLGTLLDIITFFKSAILRMS